MISSMDDIIHDIIGASMDDIIGASMDDIDDIFDDYCI